MSTRNKNHNGGEDAVTDNMDGCSSMPVHDSFKGANCEENEKDSHQNRHVRFSMSSTSTHIFRSATYDDDSSGGDNDKDVDGGEDNDHCVEVTSPQRSSTNDNNNENDKDEPGSDSDSRCQRLKSSVRTSRYDNKRDGRGYQPRQQQHQRTCHLGRKSRQLRVRKMLQEQIRRNDTCGSGNSNDDHDSHHDSHHEDDAGQTTSSSSSSSPTKESRQPQEVPQQQQRRIHRGTQRRHSKPNHHKNRHRRHHSNSSNKKALVVENKQGDDDDDDDDDDVFSGGTHSTAVCSSSIFSGSGIGNCSIDEGEGEDEDKRNSPPVSPTGITIDTDKYLKKDGDNDHDDIILNITDWKIRQRTMTY